MIIKNSNLNAWIISLETHKTISIDTKIYTILCNLILHNILIPSSNDILSVGFSWAGQARYGNVEDSFRGAVELGWYLNA